jgi:EAL domain-containing protein (putative c-di-GMP-specific phosphodiesterase class I)/DNA-binding NarL/FixJ family response regulator
MDSIRVLVIGDAGAGRESLEKLIAQDPELELAGLADGPVEAARLAVDERADVALVEMSMRAGGAATARAIRRCCADVRIVALSDHEGPSGALEMLGAGASAYLVAGTPADELRAAIRNAVDWRPAAGEGDAPPAPVVELMTQGDGDAAAAEGTIRVLCADDDPGVLELLTAVIATDPELMLVGTAHDADQAIRLARIHRPHVAVIDAMMPAGGGARAAREIAEQSPATQIVALSGRKDQAVVLDMLKSGAMSYLVKGDRNDAILAAIRKAHRGEANLSPAVTAGVIAELIVQLERHEGESERWRSQLGRIQRVLAGTGLTMVGQPIFNLATGAVVGVEALSRFVVEPWRTPDVWFGEAALVGLGEELELLAVRAALADFDKLPRHAWMSVNVSPATATSPRFLEALAGAPLERLVIEMTEHAPVADYHQLNAALDQVRGRGVRLAIDDAGAGFASLRHVLRLAPDFIKLDITLSHDIGRDATRRALGRALISFAREIDATIVAEGIETQEELDNLFDLGVPIGQGFHLARPEALPLGELTANARAAA